MPTVQQSPCRRAPGGIAGGPVARGPGRARPGSRYNGTLDVADHGGAARVRKPRGRLFWKYVVVFAGLVSGALLASGLIEIYFSYQENKDALVAIQREKALAAAARIEQFIKEIERQVGWASQPQIGVRATLGQRRFDFLRLLRQVPAVTEISLLDGSGREQLNVSRLAMDREGSGT